MASGGSEQVPYTLETTDFHDVLIQRGIITREQALISKGMTVKEANALLENEALQEASLEAASYHKTSQEMQDAKCKKVHEKIAEAEEDDDDELLKELEEDDDSEEILRKKDLKHNNRMQELKDAAQQRKYGEVKEIFRQDWMREVNDASTDAPVVVNLYQDSVESTLLINKVFAELAQQHRDVKFLRIISTDAIEGWPDASLPTVFVYRDGEMDVQLDAEKLCSKGELSTTSIVKALEYARVVPVMWAKRSTDQ